MLLKNPYIFPIILPFSLYWPYIFEKSSLYYALYFCLRPLEALLRSKYSLFQIFPRIFSETLTSLGEENKHSGVLGIPEMLACLMAKEVFTTASANGDEEAGPINGPGAVVAVPATSACGVELCGAPWGPHAEWQKELQLEL